MHRQGWKWIVILIMAGMVYAVIAPNFHGCSSDHARSETMQNLHAIQLAIERYWDDHGEYPIDLGILQKEAYLPTNPRNAYTHGYKRRPMRQVALDSREFLGDFAYLPLAGTKGVQNYELLAFGKIKGTKLSAGDEDWKHIALRLARIERTQ